MAFCLDHHIMFHAEIERCWKCREESEKACADAGGHDFRPWHDMKCPDGVWEVRHCMTCGFGEDRKKPNDTQGYKDYRALVDALHKTFNDPVSNTKYGNDSPCDCITLYGGVWMQDCYCMNSGDLATAQDWCTRRNAQPLPAQKTCLHTWREGTCTTACGHTYHATHEDVDCGGCGKPIYAGWGARPALSDQEKEQA